MTGQARTLAIVAAVAIAAFWWLAVGTTAWHVFSLIFWIGLIAVIFGETLVGYWRRTR